jgi:hypothetical protein
MPIDPNPNDPRNIWQDQEVEKMTITLDDVRRRATRLEKVVWWRNLREYAASALAAALLVPHLWRDRGWHLAPTVLLLAGMAYVMFELHRRGRSNAVSTELGLVASVEFYRRELERQRDALRSIWSWYLLPFAPGLLAVLVESAVDRGINALLVLSGIFFVGLFVAVLFLNDRAARKLDRKIKDLRNVETPAE